MSDNKVHYYTKVIFIQKLFGVDYNMISPQCSIRIPKELDARLIAYAKQNHVTKTKVMIDALAHYLSRTGNVPLIDRVAEIEQRVAVLEASIKNMN